MPTPAKKPAVPTRKEQEEGLRRLAQDENARMEALKAFKKHTQETTNLDVLDRCKKLNDFLSKDFLNNLKNGGAGGTADLKQILEILGQGPKRPACLEKPGPSPTSSKAQQDGSVQGSGSSTGRKSLADSAAAAKPRPAHAGGILGTYDVDRLLGLLPDEEGEGDAGPGAEQQAAQPSSRPASSHTASSCSASGPSTASSSYAADDVDDLIGLLNAACAPAQPALPQHAAAAAAAQQERERQQAKAAAAAEEAARAAAAAAKAAEEERHRQQRAAEEAAQRQREREQREQAEREKQQRDAEAAAERQRQAQLEREQRQLAAAGTIQRCWRGRVGRRAAAGLAAERRQEAAALRIQAALRGRQARQRAQLLRRAQALCRARAARVIQGAWRSWVAGGRGWHLGPLRVRPSGTGERPSSASVHAGDLAARPIRLRSTADARLAPEEGAGGGPDDEAARHRTVLATRARGEALSAEEAARRGELSARAVMAGSEHRDAASALVVALASSSSASGNMGASGAGAVTSNGSMVRSPSLQRQGSQLRASMAAGGSSIRTSASGSAVLSGAPGPGGPGLLLRPGSASLGRRPGSAVSGNRCDPL